MKSEPKRRYALDWLKVFTVLVVLFYHMGRIFSDSEWLINNDHTSLLLQKLTGFAGQWRMPLLFFVSGVGTFYALGARTGRHYVQERAIRLLIPLAFGVLIVVPPQAYYASLHQSTFDGSFLQFYPRFFRGRYPEGSFNWGHFWGHLWFIAYLFTFSLVALPLFLHLRKEIGQKITTRLARFLAKPGAIFLLGVPFAGTVAALFALWPATWANYLFYFSFFVYGYLVGSNEALWRAITAQRKAALLLTALFFMVIPTLLHWVDYTPNGGYPQRLLFDAIWALSVLFMVLALLGFAENYLNFNSKVLQYANDAAYPVYILHQTVIVIIGFYVVQWDAHVWVKFAVISTASLTTILLVYDLLIKRTSATRLLFGVKPKRIPEPQRQDQPVNP